MREPGPAPSVAFHPAMARRTVTFGRFRFDWQDQTLSRDGSEVRLPPRALALLAYLLERPGRIVTKQELLEGLWKEAFVSESSLTEAVGVLRQALGDSAAGATYIQTVHRRGYRFVAPIDLSSPEAPPLTVVPAHVPPPAPAHRPSVRSRTWSWRAIAAGTAALALVAALAAVAWTLTRDSAKTVTRVTITLPESTAPAPGLSASTVVDISPDGRRFVYVAGSTGSYRLYLRALDRFDATAIAGTEGAHGAFFSPEGDRIGFFRGGRLFVTRVPDGEPLDLAAAGQGAGGWWHHDNAIFIATAGPAGIIRVPSAGGQPTPVPTGPFDPATLRQPSVMADGRTLVATRWRLNVRDSEIVAIDLLTGGGRILSRGVHARPLTASHVAFLLDGRLVALPIEGDATPTPLLSGVMTGVRAAGQYAISASGTLVYVPDTPARTLRRLQLIDANGQESPLPFELRAFQNAVVSPDGGRVATTIYDNGASDLWVGDIRRGTLLKLTSEGGTIEPVWTPDGRAIYFAATRDGEYRMYRIAADGSGPATRINVPANIAPTSVGRDFLIGQRLGGRADDLVRIDAITGAVTDWLATPAHEGYGRLSPNGDWLAYESNRTGRREIFLRRLSGGAEVQLTTDGGTFPAWGQDGDAVYAISRQRLVRIPVPGGRPGAVELVRADPTVVLASPRGRQLVAVVTIEEARPLTTLHVVGHWLTEVGAHLAR